MDDNRGERRSERRVHLSEAAEILGVSKDAVRMRVKRGTLRSEKGEDGRVYVWVNVSPGVDPNAVHPQGEVEPYRELIEELHDRVRFLENQLEQANERDRENRRIVAVLTSRLPQLEAPSEPREAPPEATEQPGRVEEPQAPQEGRPAGSQRAPWWRRIFGV